MAKVGIMDSGVGGLSVYREMRKLLPSCDYVYYADNANCPYGTKSPEFILGRCRSIVSSLLKERIDAMVLACNTATAAAIGTLRSEFAVPFIGMEPAVKPAALGTRSGVVGVLATEGTLKASKYIDTRDRYCDSVKIVERVGEGFVETVEKGVLDGPEVEALVEKALRPLLDAGADTIVLGCTHYPFLLPVIQRIAGPSVRIIDPAPCVARRLAEVLDSSGVKLSGEGSLTLLSSGNDIDSLFAKIIN